MLGRAAMPMPLPETLIGTITTAAAVSATGGEKGSDRGEATPPTAQQTHQT